MVLFLEEQLKKSDTHMSPGSPVESDYSDDDFETSWKRFQFCVSYVQSTRDGWYWDKGLHYGHERSFFNKYSRKNTRISISFTKKKIIPKSMGFPRPPHK